MPRATRFNFRAAWRAPDPAAEGCSPAPSASSFAGLERDGFTICSRHVRLFGVRVPVVPLAPADRRANPFTMWSTPPGPVSRIAATRGWSVYIAHRRLAPPGVAPTGVVTQAAAADNGSLTGWAATAPPPRGRPARSIAGRSIPHQILAGVEIVDIPAAATRRASQPFAAGGSVFFAANAGKRRSLSIFQQAGRRPCARPRVRQLSAPSGPPVRPDA